MTNRAICFAATLRYRQEQDLRAYAQKAAYHSARGHAYYIFHVVDKFC